MFGLTSEIVEGERWLKDKVSKVVARDMLLDFGAEVAGTYLPGGSLQTQDGVALSAAASRRSPTGGEQPRS